MENNMYIRKLLLLLFIVLAGGLASCGKGDTSEAIEKEVKALSAEVKVSTPVTFVEIGSLRCVPCKMMQPVMDKVAAVYGSKVKIVFHDVWTPSGRPYAAKYGIRAIPTQVFLDSEGREFFRHTGYFPFEKIKELFESKGIR